MSGINGGHASRSNMGNRSNLTSSVVIDLTEDNVKDKSRRERRNEKAKKKPTLQVIDLSLTSDDEPPAPPKLLGPGNPLAKTYGKSPAKTPPKPPAKSPKCQDRGTYSLTSESEFEGEPRMNVSGSVSKELPGDSRNNTTTRQSPLKSKSNVLETKSNVPLRRGTARKTGSVSHRRSDSGSVGYASSKLAQSNGPNSASSAPEASKSHGTLSKLESASNRSRTMSQQGGVKATTSSKSSHVQLHPFHAHGDVTRTKPVASPLVPLSINDTYPSKDSASNISSTYPESKKVETLGLKFPSSPETEESPVSAKNALLIGHDAHSNNEDSRSKKDTETPRGLDSQKSKDLLRESRMEEEVEHSKSKERENQDSNTSISRKVPAITCKVIEAEAKHNNPGPENNGNSSKTHKGDNGDNGDNVISRAISQPGANENSDLAEGEIINDEILSGADNFEASRVPYQKKGNHGGARRGAAWEQQKLQKSIAIQDKGIDEESAEDHDDIQPFPIRKRKRGEDPNLRLISEPSSIRSASPSLKEFGEEGRGGWEVQMHPISIEKSSKCDDSSKMVRPELSTDDIQKILAKVERTMMEDRGRSVRNILEKRQVRAQAAMNSDFLDDESPFASMKAADANTEGAVKCNLRTNKKTKNQTYVVPIIVGDGGVERTPNYTHHTNVIRNHLTGDDEKLRYIPLVDDETSMDKYRQELNAAYAEAEDDPRERELISQLDRQLDVFLENLGYDNCDRFALIRYFLGHQSGKLSYSTREKNLVLKTLGGPLSGELYKTMKRISEKMTEAWDIGMEDVVLSKSRFKKLVEYSKAQVNERSGNQPSPTERLETMSQFHCLICHAAVCTSHGEYNLRKVSKDIPDDGSSPASPARSSRRSDWEYMWDRFIMNCPDAFRKHNARNNNNNKKNKYWQPENWNTDIDTVEECGDQCYRGRTEWVNFTWTDEEEEELKRMLSIAKPHRPCSIVDIIDKPCWQIYIKILNLEDKPPVTRSLISKPKKCEPVGWYDPKAVPRNRGLKPGWQDATIAHMHDQRVQSVPCVHDGPCRREMNCYCVINTLPCEQFCGCPDNCGRRFAGCSCHAEGLACISDTCICIQMNRECGDQCDTCGAIPRIRAQNRFKERLFQNGCQNIALQRGVNKKLILGKSQLQGVGFGLFTVEPVKKGDFLIEYVGEVISSDESERRPLIHSDEDPSFLFDINKEWVIDAARLGNKARFINHAETEADGQNCMAKILLVNGEHRIAFRASRDIKIGEELFFNYGKKFSDVQWLDKKIGDSEVKMPKTNKGVVTGKKALAELDGLGGKRGARRKRLREMVEELKGGGTAKRKKGSQRGRPRGKAVKKAGSSSTLTSQGHKNVDGDDDEMIDDDPTLHPNMTQDSDDDDETFIGNATSDVEMGGAEGVRRTRRTAKTPAKYSR